MEDNEEDLPPCKDPELQRQLFRLLKQRQEERKQHITSRMEELLAPLLEQQAKLPSAKRKAAAPPPAADEAAAPAAPATEAAEVAEVQEEETKVEPVVEEAAEKTGADDEGDASEPMENTESKRAANMAWMWQQRGIQEWLHGHGTTVSLDIDLQGLDWFMHTPLDIAAGVMIALNVVVSFAKLDWQGYQINVDYGTELGTPQAPGSWLGAELAFDISENLFAAVFLGELLLRLWYFRCDFFMDKLNILDGFVVVVTSIDTFILTHTMGDEEDAEGNGGNLGFIRIIRYCKLVRTLRFVRAMQLCSHLRVLIRTILSSFASLFWSMVILGAFMLMSALFLCQTLQDYIRDETQALDQRKWVNQHYGTATKAVWTMFEITFSGGWPGFTRKIIENVSPLYSIFFLFYVGGVVFAVIGIITALFLKDTLAVAANDQDMMMQQKAKAHAQFANKLREVFEEADESGDGMVNWEEFEAMINNPKAKASLAAMDMDSHEVESLFRLLDDGDGTVSFDEFLNGVVRLKGSARSMDVLAILHGGKKVLDRVSSMTGKLEELAEIEEEIHEHLTPR